MTDEDTLTAGIAANVAEDRTANAANAMGVASVALEAFADAADAGASPIS